MNKVLYENNPRLRELIQAVNGAKLIITGLCASGNYDKSLLGIRDGLDKFSEKDLGDIIGEFIFSQMPKDTNTPRTFELKQGGGRYKISLEYING